MKNNLYNSNDEDHQHVINLLKKLPREKAPENFEYNLKVRIENKNFNLKPEPQRSFLGWKILVPAAGSIVAALLIFTISFNESENLDNPFQIAPQPRTDYTNNISSADSEIGNRQELNIVSENDVVISNEIDEAGRSKRMNSEDKKLLAEPTSRPDFPFNKESSTDLDKVRDQSRKSSAVGNNASLAGRSNTNSFFNGFFIREEVDKEYVDKLKARMDSLKKAEILKRKKMKIAD